MRLRKQYVLAYTRQHVLMEEGTSQFGSLFEQPADGEKAKKLVSKGSTTSNKVTKKKDSNPTENSTLFAKNAFARDLCCEVGKLESVKKNDLSSQLSNPI